MNEEDSETHLEASSLFVSFMQEVATYFIPDRELDLKSNQFDLLITDLLTYPQNIRMKK